MKIKVEDLFKAAILDLGVSEIHPLHKAMLEECCENAIENEQGVTDLPTLIYAVRVAFITCNSMMKGTIKAALSEADLVTINYRGLSIHFDSHSPYIQD